MELERLLRDGRVLQAVLGTSRAEIDALIPQLEEVWQQQLAQRPNRQRAVGAGAKGKLAGAERKLSFILFYLKVYPTFDVLSCFFALDSSQCCRWGHKLLPLLEQVLGRQLVLPKRQITSLVMSELKTDVARPRARASDFVRYAYGRALSNSASRVRRA